MTADTNTSSKTFTFTQRAIDRLNRPGFRGGSNP